MSNPSFILLPIVCTHISLFWFVMQGVSGPVTEEILVEFPALLLQVDSLQTVVPSPDGLLSSLGWRDVHFRLFLLIIT